LDITHWLTGNVGQFKKKIYWKSPHKFLKINIRVVCMGPGIFDIPLSSDEAASIHSSIHPRVGPFTFMSEHACMGGGVDIIP
jgi:hypothetical protein